MSQGAIVELLNQSISSSTAKSAESGLRALESHRGFAIDLLQVVASNGFPISTRLAGALFFKNFIKRSYIDEDGMYKMAIEDVETLKSQIVSLMIQLPNNLQVQIGELVSIIADSDFPDRWPTLLDDLISKLSAEDMATNKGVLIVAHSIFKRWRPLFRSDALFIEIKMVLDKFAAPFLNLLTTVDTLIDSNSNNKQQLELLFENMLLLSKIYYDLNCQDIPEFFEDNMSVGMGIMHKYLSYQNPLLQDADEEHEIDVLTKVKASICELLQLYTQRYQDVFEPLIAQFIQTVWNLLVTIGPQSKYDILVSKSLSFLTSITKLEQHLEIFKSPELLREITEKVILPNMKLREVDEELFEDDPIEYTRRDLEGSDSDTRRRSSTDFLRELKLNDESAVTRSVMSYVDHYLAEFQQDKSNWRSKDIAVYLFSALLAKGAITNVGVTATNLLLDVVQFFATNIAPDLVNSDVHPILKVDAIKFIYVFRNQLTKVQLLEAFPLLSSHFQNDNYVVYTYTAVTIEKILSIRNPENHQLLLINKSDLSSDVAKGLLMNLFGLILAKSSTPEKLAENEFLMKCIMRILLTSEDFMMESSQDLLVQLVKITEAISRNPSNPKFNHYTFESIAILIKFNAKPPLTMIPRFMELILPTFLNILGQDVQEFASYVFQILSYMLELLPEGQELPLSYKQLIKPLLSPSVWELRGNIPAVTRLLKAIIKYSPQDFNSPELITPVLGVFQKLIASKANETYGFDLLETVLICVPINTLLPLTSQIAMLLLQRLQNSRTEKFVKRFLLFLSLICSYGENANVSNPNNLNSRFVIQLIDQVQDGLFGQILTNFMIPSSKNFNNLNDKKLIITGFTKLIVENLEFYQEGAKYFDKLLPILDNLILLVTSDSLQNYSNIDNFADGEIDDLSFGSSFNKLVVIGNIQNDPYSNINSRDSLKLFFKDELAKLNQVSGGILNSIMPSLSEEAKLGLRSLGI